MSAPAVPVPCVSKRARGTESDVVDRISSLPDDLLHHMMSYLPMPEVVRTSLLSPRWRYLWASAPFIRIDRMDFASGAKMEEFGDHLLHLRDGAVPLEEARIFIRRNESKSSVWIRHAIRHKARSLHAYGRYDSYLAKDAMMCPSQHLKIIRLQGVFLIDECFRPLNKNYFSVLEHLELETCNIWGTGGISSGSLKSLQIIRCVICQELLICARNLTHLSIRDPKCYNDGDIVTRDLSALVTASISLRSGHDSMCNHHILDGLSNATTLELQAPLHKLAFGLQTCPVFSNLTSLVLGEWCTAADFLPLLYILRRSLNLKDLIFKLKMEECKYCMYAESIPPEASSGSSYPSIERITIYCCKDEPKLGPLVQTLLPFVTPDGKMSIQVC